MKVRVFTDGACSENPGPGGWGVVFNMDEGCKTFSGGENSTTNNRMELTAVIESYRRILTHKRKYKTTYEIFSDSAYVVNSINNCWLERWQLNNWKTAKGDPVKNDDLWKELIRLRAKVRNEGIIVMVLKVKGHSGNCFNELADKLAKEQVSRVNYA